MATIPSLSDQGAVSYSSITVSYPVTTASGASGDIGILWKKRYTKDWQIIDGVYHDDELSDTKDILKRLKKIRKQL